MDTVGLKKKGQRQFTTPIVVYARFRLFIIMSLFVGIILALCLWLALSPVPIRSLSTNGSSALGWLLSTLLGGTLLLVVYRYARSLPLLTFNENDFRYNLGNMLIEWSDVKKMEAWEDRSWPIGHFKRIYLTIQDASGEMRMQKLEMSMVSLDDFEKVKAFISKKIRSNSK